MTEPLKDALPLLEEEAPTVRDAVLERDGVLLPLTVLLGVAAAVPVFDCVRLAVPVPVPLCVPVALLLNE